MDAIARVATTGDARALATRHAAGIELSSEELAHVSGGPATCTDPRRGASMARTTQAPAPVPSSSPTGLTSLGETIFLDHYARKSPPRAPLAVGDTVVISTDPPHAPTGRWAGAPVWRPTEATVRLADGTLQRVPIQHVDKPLETQPADVWRRVARGIAALEATAPLRACWRRRFYRPLTPVAVYPGGTHSESRRDRPAAHLPEYLRPPLAPGFTCGHSHDVRTHDGNLWHTGAAWA